jgi:hypothetical protein
MSKKTIRLDLPMQIACFVYQYAKPRMLDLNGSGGWMNGRYFHCSFPDFILSESLHINLCEMLTVVVALNAWGSNFSGKK